MIRDAISKEIDHDPEFEWRGESVSRIENLSDIAFALALSMLVAGSGTPATYEDLRGFLFSILPVAAGFSVLYGIWMGHYTFFRRFGLNNRVIIRYNAVLIFIVLYMAYPLRFAFDSLFAFILHRLGDSEMIIKMRVDDERSGVIIGYFAAFYATTHFILALMYRHAIKKRDFMHLKPKELVLAKRELLVRWLLGIMTSIVGILAYFSSLNGFAGLLLFFTFVPYLISKRTYPNPS